VLVVCVKERCVLCVCVCVIIELCMKNRPQAGIVLEILDDAKSCVYLSLLVNFTIIMIS
jgi:hypothetical protein